MRFKHFKSVNLNGYLNFDFKMNSGTTFLVGINGSGKTSVLKAIMGLISPDIDWLMNTKFDSISILLEHDNIDYIINTISTGDGRTLQIFSRNDLLASVSINFDTYASMIRRTDEYAYDDGGEIISLREISSHLPGGNFAVDLLKQFPTPVFLGLDRSTLPLSRERAITRRMKRPRATLRAFMDESVSQAEASALRAASRANADRQRIATKLREDIILTLFSDETGGNNYTLPRRSDIRDYEKYRKSLKTALKLINISEARVSETVDPFFSKLMTNAESLVQVKEITDVFRNNKKPDVTRSFLAWSEMTPRLSIFKQVADLVGTFDSDEKTIFLRTNAYLGIMNSFFHDSEKRLFFKDDGGLALALPSDPQADISLLSSGERQLFVLITTLMFGENEDQADILIIDEPELSLHIKWQEMFVESLLQARPGIQLILATHSPSIILDRDELCVDLA